MGELVPILGIMIPILCLMIPIVAILTTHQRRMAEIINNRSQVPNEDLMRLHQEIAELRSLVHQQAIALDTRLSQVNASSNDQVNLRS